MYAHSNQWRNFRWKMGRILSEYLNALRYANILSFILHYRMQIITVRPDLYLQCHNVTHRFRVASVSPYAMHCIRHAKIIYCQYHHHIPGQWNDLLGDNQSPHTANAIQHIHNCLQTNPKFMLITQTSYPATPLFLTRKQSLNKLFIK